ncbi:DUF948 domain-containing protein [Bacillus thermotolerans]|uniref:DUF948 domain-containing protein n=1 Tax=Bacillus thermotolerans TaxID=1221996 RepID=UPI0005893049|nr:DUF948 domain-containing protein [Bacillus thermotolerans]KKB42613.1 hypothetical protein QY96_01386 [Bacillus thermotolerans]
MEIIGWISLAIVVGALIYLGISGFSTYKSMKPKIDELKAASERMKEKQAAIKSETDQLKEKQQRIKEDIDQKKEKIMYTVEEAKQTPESVKQLGTALNFIDEETKLRLPIPKRKSKAETV